ncbi:hypothetical protein CDL15_Pgr021000 [Punica granatum]|uniref:GRF-type domain-containing protein n=1 Tax=Punica granatum TaxID=22663 RepID=A0A218Y015_PUNGR|nr:hypothetical protein CDL15_Pgr021000 [Punica granatum]
MESVMSRGKRQKTSRGKARRGESCGSRESATLSGSSAGVCRCGLRLQQKISRTANNPGRRFVGCPRYRDNGGCGYFSWIDHPFEASISEIVAEEEVSSSEWEMKYLKLKMKELEKELKHRHSRCDVRVVVFAICICIMVGNLFGMWLGCKLCIGK